MTEAACDHLRKDHREMEEHMDQLLGALLHLTPELVPAVQAELEAIQRLETVHFEKEENVFYPALRETLPDLLTEMDHQHEQVREVEKHVEELLANRPKSPDSRWLNELRSFGIELHDHIQHHIVAEEDQLFRLAAGVLSGEQQERLAGMMDKVQPRAK